jgi:sporulation protein YlmC with PRC-barrel domain
MVVRLFPFLASLILTSAALAQGNPSPGGQLTQMPQGATRLSDMIGVEVVGSDITKLGEVEDVLIARDGTVNAVVIEVGGALGVGGRSVAVPYGSLLWNFDVGPTTGPSASNTGGTALEDGGFEARRAESTAPGNPPPESTGTVGNPAVPAEGLQPRGSTVPVTGSGAPTRAVLRMTRDELDRLPEVPD